MSSILSIRTVPSATDCILHSVSQMRFGRTESDRRRRPSEGCSCCPSDEHGGSHVFQACRFCRTSIKRTHGNRPPIRRGRQGTGRKSGDRGLRRPSPPVPDRSHAQISILSLGVDRLGTLRPAEQSTEKATLPHVQAVTQEMPSGKTHLRFPSKSPNCILRHNRR